MEVTHTYTTVVKGSLGTINSSPEVVTGDAEVAIENTVDIGDTLTETLAIDASQIKAFYIWADRDITVTTNAGANTWDVKANKPVVWNGQGSCPITVDVTSVHFNNSSGLTEVNVKAEFLLGVAS